MLIKPCLSLPLRLAVRRGGVHVARRWTSSAVATSETSVDVPKAAPRVSSTQVVYVNAWMQELDDDEEPPIAEEHLPPWRQLKPDRWESPEEDSFLPQLPKVQVEETGRSGIVGFTSVGIVVFFSLYWWGRPSPEYLDRRPAAG
eukprot:TRINITY_DN100465_c0_g1_i1.p1 TRINITY_DN100465_c0_g1~~TRINITY_DN100465_c0_g1_i1.p1  ORF type:complete len:144 (+),score=29.07 TRINITY_DN100465_c0_g1_i1:34-465(+)